MLLYVSIAAAAIVVFDNAGEQEEDKVQQELKSKQLVQCLRLFRRLEKRCLALEDEVNARVAKKPKVKFDYERARACVYQDYLGPDPLFEKYFERIFRVSRGITEQFFHICSGTHSFFTSPTNKVKGDG
jgi:hypothetical protein